MQMTQLIRKIGRNDVKLIGRDSFLIMMLAYMLVVAFILRFGMPRLNTYLIENGVLPNDRIDMTFADAYPMLVVYFALYLGAVLVGVMFGFMLLDEKDDNTIKAMLVTPVSLNQYVLYRVGVPIVIAFIGVIIEVLIINQAVLPLWQLIPIAAGAALAAPIATLFFATFADNKVQGFAMSKFVGVAGMMILGGWFIAEPFQWLFALFPPFLSAKAYWMALDGNNLWWLALIVGIVLQIGMIYLLVQRFHKVAYK